MPTVRALRGMPPLPDADFARQHGPAALLQQPADPMMRELAWGVSGTVHMAHRTRLAERALQMVRDFEALDVHFLAGGPAAVELSVGRISASTLPLPDPSVSKHHADLRWDPATQKHLVRDAGSLNGTFLNAAQLGREWQALDDGDTLAFGDCHFVYLLAPTLRQHLASMAALAPR